MNKLTVLIASDSHGRVDRLRSLFEMHKNADALVYLGDGLTDLDRAGVRDYRFTVFALKGNCDGSTGSLTVLRAKEELAFNLDTVRFFALHGHTRGVKSTIVNALYAAESNGADVLLYGHTHEPFSTYLPAGEYNLSKPMYVFNPGSVADYSFGLCEIRDGQILLSHGVIY